MEGQSREGDLVKIWYDKSNPKYSYIDGYKEDIVAIVVSLIAGIVDVLIVVYVGMFLLEKSEVV